MKKTILKYLVVASCTLVSFSVNAQWIKAAGGDEAYPSKLELAAIVYGVDIHDQFLYSFSSQLQRKDFYMGGITMKLYRPSYAYRITLSRFSEDYNFDVNSPLGNIVGFEPFVLSSFTPGNIITSIIRNVSEIRTGVQFKILEKRLSVSMLCDLGYRYTTEKRIATKGLTGSSVTFIETAKENYLAVYNGLSFRYQLSKSFFVGYECSAALGISHRKLEKLPQSIEYRAMFNFMPASFSAGFYF